MVSASTAAEGIDLEIFSSPFEHQYQNRLVFKGGPIDVIEVTTVAAQSPAVRTHTIHTGRELTDWLTDEGITEGDGGDKDGREHTHCRLRLLMPHVPDHHEADPLVFPNDYSSVPFHARVPFYREHFNLILNGMRLPVSTSAALDSTFDHFHQNRMGGVNPLDSRIGLILRSTTRGILAMNTTLSLSYDASSKTTNALLLGLSPAQGQFMRDRIMALAPVATHPAFLPTLLLSTRQSLLEKLVGLELDKLFGVEAASGNTGVGYSDLRPDFIGEDLPKDERNTKIAISVIQLVTAWEQYSKTLVRQLHVLEKLIADVEARLGPNEDALRVMGDILREKVGFVEEGCHSMLHQAQYVKDRATAQVSAIYNSIAQKGNDVSREIALMSQADGSAMKSIAVLTMTFLPATFLATYFSTPNSTPSDPQPWFYWVIAIPLTLCTLAAWAFWDRFSARKRGESALTTEASCSKPGMRERSRFPPPPPLGVSSRGLGGGIWGASANPTGLPMRSTPVNLWASDSDEELRIGSEHRPEPRSRPTNPHSFTHR